MVEMVAMIQAIPLDMIFDPQRLSRMVDMGEMGTDNLGIDELFTTVRTSIWSELRSRTPIDVHRRSLQQAHVDRLVDLVLHRVPSAPADAVSLARLELQEIRGLCTTGIARSRDRTTRAHLSRIQAEVTKALDADIALGASTH